MNLEPFHQQENADALLPHDPDRVLSPRAAELITQAWSPSTHKAYNHDWSNFADWCEQVGRQAFPATPETLADYVAHLADDHSAAPATIDRVLGTLASYHKAQGSTTQNQGMPNKERFMAARLALAGYRKAWADDNRVRRAAAITVDDLLDMLEAAGSGLAGLRDRTLLLLGYTMMARRAELAALNISDVVFVEEGLEVFIARSKTDKQARGATVPVPYSTRLVTCPVRTTRAYLEELAQHGLTSGPLLRSVDRHGRLAGTPQASGKGTGRITGAGINLIVKRLAKAAGLEGVTAHSLRSGPATAAAKGGAHRNDIARQGRWNPKSTAFDGYIRPAEAWTDNPIRKIGL